MLSTIEHQSPVLDCDRTDDEVVYQPKASKWLIALVVVLVIALLSGDVIGFGGGNLWEFLLVVPLLMLYCYLIHFRPTATNQPGIPANEEDLRKEIRDWLEDKEERQRND